MCVLIAKTKAWPDLVSLFLVYSTQFFVVMSVVFFWGGSGSIFELHNLLAPRDDTNIPHQQSRPFSSSLLPFCSIRILYRSDRDDL